ncbi:MAG: response regulator [Anaerolineae bacterium]|nr:response regulator [Anaerolineae bacterium]
MLVAHNSTQDHEDTLNELRVSVLEIVLMLIFGGIWCLLAASYLVIGYPSPTTLVLCAVVESICVFSYALRRKHFGWAASALIAGLWTCTVIATQHFGTALVPYLFGLILLVASVLLRRRMALLLALITTYFLISAPFGKSADAAANSAFLPIVFMWFSLFTSLAAHRSLYQALDIAWLHQDYALRQMHEARQHRQELMRLTKDLKQTKEDLERANSQAQHARRAAEEARRMKAQFAATVSHELRTPINLIVGFSDSVIKAPQSYGVPLPSAYWSDLNTIYRNARHLQGLINDVLDISQIEAGHMAILKEDVPPEQIVSEAAELVRDEIQARGLRFEVIVAEQLPLLSVDKLRIRQVLLNLLGNAIRFTDTGSITLQVKRLESRVVISVADTGIGIKQEDLARVFEEFHQLDGALNQRFGGSGLGLTLSQQFAEMHGGQLTVTSSGIPGQGSIFTLSLPLPQQQMFQDWEQWQRRTLESRPDRGRYFVVLDEDPAVTQLFERYTEHHAAVGVSSVQQVARLVQAIQPTALIVDSHLESQARATLTEYTVPIITCPMPSGKRAMQRYGISDFLVKPVTFEALCTALDKLAVPVHNVLIVDDEPDMVRLFTRMFQRLPAPCQVQKAYSGKECLRLLARQRPDVLILDLLLPDMDGLSIAQQIKRDPLLAEVPIILASAFGAADALQKTTEGTFSVAKQEGFEPIELVRCVEALVGALTPAIAIEPAS